MDYYPLFAQLTGQPCLLVGGGAVATRKARQLLAAGADVTVVAPEVGTELSTAVAAGRLRHVCARFSPAFLKDALIVIAATNDATVNAAVSAAAARARRLCNVVDDPDLSSFIMPAVIDRSPVIVAISTGGAAPLFARLLRQRIDDWLPQRIGSLAAWAGRRRAAVTRRISDRSLRLRFWERILDGPAADACLNGDVERADAILNSELDADKTPQHRGQAWLVGAGPGDSGLLTRRGAALLRRADVVLHDRLVSAEIIALARRDATLICVGKTPHGQSTDQREIDAMLVQYVRDGLRVCRLKGGDPFIFGRGGEEITALARAGLPYEVVPGINAAAGCAAAASIPLTHRDLASAVTLVTGHDADATGAAGADWAGLAASRQTLAIYMSVARLADICSRLIEYGRAPTTPVAIVENGTSPNQRLVGGTLATIASLAAAEGIAAPAMLIVGDVVALAGTLRTQQAQARQAAYPATVG